MHQVELVLRPAAQQPRLEADRGTLVQVRVHINMFLTTSHLSYD